MLQSSTETYLTPYFKKFKNALLLSDISIGDIFDIVYRCGVKPVRKELNKKGNWSPLFAKSDLDGLICNRDLMMKCRDEYLKGKLPKTRKMPMPTNDPQLSLFEQKVTFAEPTKRTFYLTESQVYRLIRENKDVFQRLFGMDRDEVSDKIREVTKEMIDNGELSLDGPELAEHYHHIFERVFGVEKWDFIDPEKYLCAIVDDEFLKQGGSHEDSLLDSWPEEKARIERDVDKFESGARLDENALGGKWNVDPNKVLVVKKFLDDGFVRGSMQTIGSDGYPKTPAVIGMKLNDGSVGKNMTPQQLLDLLLDRFQKIYGDRDRRRAFLIQVIKDWYFKKITDNGLLSVNRY